MSEEKRVVEKSQNFLQVSGTLLETNIKISEKKGVVVKNFSGGEDKKMDCMVAEKVDFKNPALLIECQPQDEEGNVIGTYQIGVEIAQLGFGIAEKTFDKDGKLVDNDNFKGMQTVLDTYVTRKDAHGEEPTKVFVKSGFLFPNEYVSKEGEYKSYAPTITTYNVTSSGVPENDICEGNMSGIIRTIAEEVRGEDSDPTGRLKVELFFFNKKGEAYPVTFMVEEDLADDFQDFYSNGDSCKIYYDIVTKTVGGVKKTTSGGFGRKEAKTTSGFTVTELSVFKGDEAFDEESKYFIEPSDMKDAMKEREVMIEQKIKDKKEKDKNGGSKKSNGGLGTRNSKISETTVDEDDSSELPF